MGIVEGEGRGGDSHLFWIVPLMGVGLNSSGDPGRGSSCWGLVLSKEVGLLVGLSGGGGGWFWGESGVGAWTSGVARMNKLRGHSMGTLSRCVRNTHLLGHTPAMKIC